MRHGAQKSLLIGEANVDFRASVVRAAESEGFQVRQTASGDEAIELLATRWFDVVVLAQDLPDVRGEDVLAYHRARYPGSENVILTVAAGRRVDQLDLRGSFGILRKPATTSHLVSLLHDCAARITAA